MGTCPFRVTGTGRRNLNVHFQLGALIRKMLQSEGIITLLPSAAPRPPPTLHGFPLPEFYHFPPHARLTPVS